MKKSSHRTLQAVIDRFENGKAVVDFGSIGTLSVPKRYLPKDVREGDVIVTDLITDQMATERQRNLAKAVLKEILNK